jgi:ankyrin repeat protein
MVLKTTLPLLLATALIASACLSSQKKTFSTPAAELVDAAERGDEKRVQEITSQGTNINQKNENGYTALMGAAERGQVTMVAQLIALRADVNVTNRFTWNALMLACVGGHVEVARSLIAAGSQCALCYAER